MRRGWRRKFGQDTETVRTGSKEDSYESGDGVNTATLLRNYTKKEAAWCRY